MKNYIILFTSFLFYGNLFPNTDSFILITDTQKIEIQCLNVFKIKKEYVINSEEEYQKLLEESNLNDAFNNRLPECNDYKLPGIDFSKRTLLGFHTMATGCKRPNKYKIEILLDDKNKKYLFVVGIEEVGSCLPLWEKNHFYTIPKIKNGYIVEFYTNTATTLTPPYAIYMEKMDTIYSKQILSALADTIIIKSPEELNELAVKTKLVVPDVNLDLYTMLIGIKTRTESCSEPTYLREVKLNKEKKEIIYSIKIKSNGNCNNSFYKMNWMKLEGLRDMDINFIVE